MPRSRHGPVRAHATRRRRAPGFVAAALATVAVSLPGCGATEEVPGDGEQGAAGVAAAGSALVVSPALATVLAATLEATPGDGVDGVLDDGPVRRGLAGLAEEAGRLDGQPLASFAALDGPAPVLRALPRGHAQASWGLVLALDGDAALVRALLAQAAAHAALGHPEAALGRALAREGVAALPSSVAAVFEPTAAGVALAAPLGAARRAAGALAFDERELAEALRRATDALARAGRPSDLARAWAALARAAERDPVGFAALERTFGPARETAALAARLVEQVAGAAARRRLDHEGASGERFDAGPARRAHARALAATALALGGEPDAAVPLAAGAGPTSAVARARIDLARDRRREAERALRAALVVDAGHLGARLALARLYADEGRAAAARAELELALRRAPLDPRVHGLFAAVEDDAERARARAAIAAALDGPAGPWARRAVERAVPAAPPPPDPGRARILGGG